MINIETVNMQDPQLISKLFMPQLLGMASDVLSKGLKNSCSTLKMQNTMGILPMKDALFLNAYMGIEQDSSFPDSNRVSRS